jgi:hypothetical protein
MSEGFFLMHRGWRNNPIFKGEFSRADAWVWLIENACWKSSRTRIKGETVTLDRGELSFSIRFLADAWGWSKSRVDRFLADLREESMIEARSKNGTVGDQKAGQGQAIITICNYRKYQDHDDGERDNNGTTSGTRAGQQRDKEEQGNKGTIEEEPIGSPSMPETQKRAESRAVKLRADWTPMLTPAAQRIVDGWPPGKFDHEVARFRDHAADKGRTSKDWQAAFRTWITKSDEWMKQNGNRNSQAAGGFASGNRGPVDNRNSFLRSLDQSIGRSGSGQPDGPD